MTFEVDITTNVQCADVDLNALQQAVVQSLHVESVAEAVMSISLVDNAAIHKFNRNYLQHDYPTDVISFQLDWSHSECGSPGTGVENRSAGAHIEGEIMVSLECAQAEAEQLGWELQSELTLYVIHGVLHVCGYDDLDPAERQMMRAREAAVFRELGLAPIPRHAAPSVQSSDSGQEISE